MNRLKGDRNVTDKLIVLPHAGGASHAYRRLARTLPEGMDAFFHDYPGHGRRGREPLLYTMDGLVDDLLERAGAAGFFQEGWAIFGHSMGSLVAHGAIQKRIKRGCFPPAVFFASGARPPSWYHTAASRAKQPVSTLPKDLFWAKVARYGGIPKELSEHPGILGYFEEALRADFAAVETHAPDTTPMDVPIHVLYGTEDRRVVTRLDGWPSASVSQTHFHSFEGNHFFVFDHLSRVGDIVCQALAVTADISQKYPEPFFNMTSG